MTRTRTLVGLAVSVMLVFVPHLAGAASITTLYDSNNHGNYGGAVYFDLMTGSNTLSITGFETNTSCDDPFGFEVFTLLGTSVGNELDASLWTSAATGTGIGSGTDDPSLITLDNFFTLDANTTYGIAIVLDGPAGDARHYYTNGTGANQRYSNSDLRLELGSASNVPFLYPDRFYEPRVWNGTITYTTAAIPNPEPASWILFAVGSAVVGASVRKRSNRSTDGASS